MVLPINEVALCLKGHLQRINPFPMAQGLQQTIRQQGAGFIFLAVMDNGIG